MVLTAVAITTGATQLCAVYVGTCRPLMPTPRGTTHARIFDLQQHNSEPNINTLLIGSSVVSVGIKPEAFTAYDIYPFNLGSDAQSLTNSYTMINWALNWCKPNLIVLDVYPELRQSNGLESNRDFILNTEIHQTSSLTKSTLITMDLYGLWLLLQQRILSATSPRRLDKLRSNSFRLGYLPTGRPPADTIICKIKNTLTLNRKQNRALKSIIKLVDTSDIKLILINPPQLCETAFAKPKLMEGLPWIEGNEWPLAKVDTLYYDDHHLREQGAELYSAWLAERVAALIN